MEQKDVQDTMKRYAHRDIRVSRTGAISHYMSRSNDAKNATNGQSKRGHPTGGLTLQTRVFFNIIREKVENFYAFYFYRVDFHQIVILDYCIILSAFFSKLQFGWFKLPLLIEK